MCVRENNGVWVQPMNVVQPIGATVDHDVFTAARDERARMSLVTPTANIYIAARAEKNQLHLQLVSRLQRHV